MVRPKKSRKDFEFLKEFGNKTVNDPQLKLMIEELSKIPDAGDDYQVAMDKIFNFLDDLLKKKIKESL